MQGMSKRKAVAAFNAAYGEVNAEGLAIPKSTIKGGGVPGNTKLIAWNVGGLRAVLSKRPELIKKIWDTEKPAVLGLMETKISQGDETAVSGQIRHLVGDSVKIFCNHSTAKKGYSGTMLIVNLEISGNKSSSIPRV